MERSLNLTANPKFDLMDELNNVCVKILLLQELKDIPIYAKVVKDLCTRNPGKKKQDPKIIHVIGQLAELMLGTIITPKYGDLRSPLVTIAIYNTSISNVLVDLRAAINIMSYEIMIKIGCTEARPTRIVL